MPAVCSILYVKCLQTVIKTSILCWFASDCQYFGPKVVQTFHQYTNWLHILKVKFIRVQLKVDSENWKASQYLTKKVWHHAKSQAVWHIRRNFSYLNNISSNLCILTYEQEPFFFKIVCSVNTQRRHYKEFDPMLFHRLCGIWRKSFIIKSYVEVESYFIWASSPDLWIMIDERAFVENLLCSRARDFLNIFVRDVLTHPIVIYHIRWYFILHFYL